MGVYKISGAGTFTLPRVGYKSMLAGNSVKVEPTFELISNTVLS
jgi:hypothetical protein